MECNNIYYAVDIGRFSLENVDRLMLSNGQSDQIFQPARFFASAGILNIQTLTPVSVRFSLHYFCLQFPCENLILLIKLP